MATFQISYSYGGCGSGTSSSYGWISSEVRATFSDGMHANGTTQLSCSDPTPIKTLEQIAINYASPYWRQGDIITLNGVPYDPFLPSCIPSWQCELPLNGYEVDGCGNRQLSLSCLPPILKWKCSGAPNFACAQAADGTYNSQAECQSVCIALPPPKKAGAGMLIGVTLLAAGAIGAVIFITRKRPKG